MLQEASHSLLLQERETCDPEIEACEAALEIVRPPIGHYVRLLYVLAWSPASTEISSALAGTVTHTNRDPFLTAGFVLSFLAFYLPVA